MRRGIIGLWIGLSLATAGAGAWVAAPATAQAQGQALQKFEVAPLTIDTAAGPRAFQVELALTPEQQMQGLMFRRQLAADAGMLFIYPQAQEIAMWMKNTMIPLDMLFIGADGKVLRVQERAQPLSLATISSGAPAKAVLELAGGSASRLGLKPGDKVRAPGLAE